MKFHLYLHSPRNINKRANLHKTLQPLLCDKNLNYFTHGSAELHHRWTQRVCSQKGRLF